MFDTRKDFDEFMAEWNQVLYCSTETSFNESLAKFRVKYENSRGAVEYINNNVVPLQRFIVQVWTISVSYLGNTATSRAEGQHRVIKEYFNSSMGDLLTAVKNLHLSSSNQLREFKARVEQEKIRLYCRFDILFDNVRGEIFSTALELVQTQISAPRPRKPCSGVFQCIYGIICGHILDNKISDGNKLEIDDFDKQWWPHHEHPMPVVPIEHELCRASWNRKC